MTLHEAIQLILTEAGKPLTASEIAKRINNQKLYTRKDHQPVPGSQVSARIRNYENTFYTEDEEIFLVGFDRDLSSNFSVRMEW